MGIARYYQIVCVSSQDNLVLVLKEEVIVMKGIVNKRFWLTLPVLGAAVIITFFLIQEMVSYGEEPIDSSVQNDFHIRMGSGYTILTWEKLCG